MAISKRTRYEVLRRDNHTCRYCGGVAPDAVLTVDHVLPVSLGGSDKPDNLVAACKDCNAGKAASNPDAPLVQNVRDDALRWAAALKQAARVRLADRPKRENYVEGVNELWGRWWYGPDKEPIPRPTDWRASVWRFYSLGLAYEDCADAVEIACSNPQVSVHTTWRYFCGVCWTMLDEMHEAAAAIVAQKEADDGA